MTSLSDLDEKLLAPDFALPQLGQTLDHPLEERLALDEPAGGRLEMTGLEAAGDDRRLEFLSDLGILKGTERNGVRVL